MSLRLAAVGAIVSLVTFEAAAAEPNPTPIAASSAPSGWAAFCVKYAVSNKRALVREAVLVQSSGDPEFDKRAQGKVVGVPAPGHPKLGAWVSLRVGPLDTREGGAEPYEGPALPEIDCSSLDTVAPRAR